LRIHNATRGTELATNARRASTYWSRLIGLLGRPGLPAGEALVIDPCSSVHTVFMRFTIDVVFADKNGLVLKTVPRLKPFRASGLLRGSTVAIELPEGTIERSATAIGDQLTFEV
jgi:uncharacterized membrane protein (UPF0127 family)